MKKWKAAPLSRMPLAEMAEYIASRFDCTPADAVYDSVAYFYEKIRKEERKDDRKDDRGGLHQNL